MPEQCKIISDIVLIPVSLVCVDVLACTLHAGCHAKGSGNGGKYSDYDVDYFTPDVVLVVHCY